MERDYLADLATLNGERINIATKEYDIEFESQPTYGDSPEERYRVSFVLHDTQHCTKVLSFRIRPGGESKPDDSGYVTLWWEEGEKKNIDWIPLDSTGKTMIQQFSDLMNKTGVWAKVQDRGMGLYKA